MCCRSVKSDKTLYYLFSFSQTFLDSRMQMQTLFTFTFCFLLSLLSLFFAFSPFTSSISTWSFSPSFSLWVFLSITHVASRSIMSQMLKKQKCLEKEKMTTERGSVLLEQASMIWTTSIVGICCWWSSHKLTCCCFRWKRKTFCLYLSHLSGLFLNFRYFSDCINQN